MNAQPTTVGEIHAITGGPKPSGHPWANVLRGLPDDAFAAWCWRQSAPQHYDSYVVGPTGQVIDVHSSTEGPEALQPGPIVVT